MGKEGHVVGEQLLHAHAETHPINGPVYDEQLLACGMIAVADHAGEVGSAEEAQKVLEGSQALPIYLFSVFFRGCDKIPSITGSWGRE